MSAPSSQMLSSRVVRRKVKPWLKRRKRLAKAPHLMIARLPGDELVGAKDQHELEEGRKKPEGGDGIDAQGVGDRGQDGYKEGDNPFIIP